MGIELGGKVVYHGKNDLNNVGGGKVFIMRVNSFKMGIKVIINGGKVRYINQGFFFSLSLISHIQFT